MDVARAQFSGLIRNLRQHSSGVVLRVLPALVRGEIKMPEAIATGQCELALVLIEPGFQLRGRGLVRRGHIFGQKLHLLRHSPFHNRVVLVQSHGETLAVKDFFLDLILHHRLELLRSWLTMPFRFEVGFHNAELVEAHDNLF